MTLQRGFSCGVPYEPLGEFPKKGDAVPLF